MEEALKYFYYAEKTSTYEKFTIKEKVKAASAIHLLVLIIV